MIMNRSTVVDLTLWFFIDIALTRLRCMPFQRMAHMDSMILVGTWIVLDYHTIAANFNYLGDSAIESTFRSLNNLLERLHASFFLYLMTSVTTFITVGNYLAAPVLISAGMTIQGLSLWGNSSPATSTTSVGKLLEGQGIVLERGPMTAEAFMVMGLSHAIGGIIFAIITHLDPMRPISVRYSLFLFSSALC